MYSRLDRLCPRPVRLGAQGVYYGSPSDKQVLVFNAFLIYIYDCSVFVHSFVYIDSSSHTSTLKSDF
jgi:hypothetical protein